MNESNVRVPEQRVLESNDSTAFGAALGDLETPWQIVPKPADELVPSWNVVGEPFLVEIQVATGVDLERSASPWLEIGSFGRVPRERERCLEFAGGRVDIDVVLAREGASFHAARLRFRSAAGCRLERSALTFTRRRSLQPLAEPRPESFAPIELDVPFFSQKDASESIRGRICSPTSLAMVLRFHGKPATPEAIAAEVFDTEQDLFGIWPRNVQVAFRHGVSGIVRRFDSWDEVGAVLHRGQPIIASIGVEKGQLAGAPYESTSGHLIVLRGIDRNGDILVNDPAGATPERGRVAYRRDQLSVCWLARGGTAYVLAARTESQNVRH